MGLGFKMADAEAAESKDCEDPKIEAILDVREREGEVQFKVLWSDTERKASWELEVNLLNPHNSMVVEQYKNAHRRKMMNIEKKVDAARSAMLDESGESDDSDDLRPRALEFEEIVEGLDEATARVRKQLHDDTHIYTLTEQLLMKSASMDPSRMTRSKMRGKLEELSNAGSEKREIPSPCEEPIMEPPLGTDSDEEPLSEVMKRSKLDQESTPSSIRGRGRGRGRGSGRVRGRPRGSTSTPRGPLSSHETINLKQGCDRVLRGRGRGRPRKLVFADVGTVSGEISNEVEDSADDSTASAAQTTPASSKRRRKRKQRAEAVPEETQDHPIHDSESDVPPKFPSSIELPELPDTIGDVQSPSLEIPSPVAPSSSSSVDLSIESFSSSPNVFQDSGDMDGCQAAAGDAKPFVKRTLPKRIPRVSIAAASSSVDDIAGMVISRQQEIENFRSVQHSDNMLSRRSQMRPHTPTRNKRFHSKGDMEETSDVRHDDANELIRTKTMTRRRLVEALPGPIFTGSIKELRSEMRDEVAAKFIPDYSTFDAKKLLEAVLAGNLNQFRKATDHFCSGPDGLDVVNEICSVISRWRGEDGGTLIHMVCRKIKCNETHEGDDLVYVLAKYSPELLSVRDRFFQIPLHIAVQKGELCRASKLLMLGSPVSWRDAHSLSPVDIAYGKGGLNMLKLLLNAGATFHELLAVEEMLPPTRRKLLFNTLLKHCGILNGLMRGARKKILRNIRETVVLSPIFIAPVKDGLEPIFRFSYTPTPQKGIDCMQVPMLFTYLAVNRPAQGKRGVEWNFRCHGPISCFAPKLNGKHLAPMTGNVPLGVPTTQLLENTFVYFCPLQCGTNVITFELHESLE
ncbi:hypothetical protein Y032_0042g565 [Ancylostoma ceylanicum]|uniref:Chromo domain-containing protein n=2 Tax=Ancylostoma ceylanicum TaxID=53326 RepID=A0A016UF99_9BILA|nr:hypothetical protein Y032_0042g565 [Ancylostoma ceylanicum]